MMKKMSFVFKGLGVALVIAFVAGVVYAGNVEVKLSGTGSAFQVMTGLGGPQNAIMHVGSDGRVGVGTVNPIDKLHVFGIQDPVAIAIESVGPGIHTELFGIHANGTPGGETALVQGDTLLDVAGVGYDGAGYSEPAVGISFEASQNWSTTGHGTEMHFRTTFKNDTTGDIRMIIDDSGNVGIGEMAPMSRLDVRGFGNTTSTTAFNVNNSDFTSLLNVKDNGNVGIGEMMPKARLDIKGAGNTSTTVALNVSNFSGSSLLHVTDNGNVGVRTTTPQSAFQVYSGYAQLDLTSGTPPTADCDAAAEYGRMKVDATAAVSRLYICTADGWVFK